MRYWSECETFLRECRHHFHDTGALLPSGLFLARALVAELRKRRLPSRILEVGPGTGSVTREIVRHLRPGDQLDAVELNGRFVAHLQRLLDRDPAFAPHRDRVRIVHAPVEALTAEADYDFIISGLPLNNFPASQVRDVLRAYQRLLKPGGTLTYFEYVLIRHLKSAFVDRRERRRLYRVGRVVGGFVRDYQVRRQRIFINVPPAIVRHLCPKPDPDRVGLSPAWPVGAAVVERVAPERFERTSLPR